jgi:flavin reductase (DIM6/NTAB) family NADH-FMN oxidoreductase RutF
MKKELDLGFASRIIQHSPVCLLTVAGKGRTDIVPVAWLTPLSLQPPLVGVAISPRRFSHDLIKKSGEFVLNVAQAEMIGKVDTCGRVSGEDTDKWQLTNFTPFEPKRVSTPLIAECSAALECALENVIPVGDHTLFIGQVLTVWADETAFDSFWKPDSEAGQTIQYFGGKLYGVINKVISG